MTSPAGSSWLVSPSSSADFPVTSVAYQTVYGGGGDGFISEYQLDGTRLRSSYFGGSGFDIISGVGVAPGGDILVAGLTLSTDLPTRHAAQTAYAGGNDMFRGQNLRVAPAPCSPGAITSSGQLGEGNSPTDSNVPVAYQRFFRYHPNQWWQPHPGPAHRWHGAFLGCECVRPAG